MTKKVEIQILERKKSSLPSTLYPVPPFYQFYCWNDYLKQGSQPLCISSSGQRMHLFEANRNFPCQCGEYYLSSYIADTTHNS